MNILKIQFVMRIIVERTNSGNAVGFVLGPSDEQNQCTTEILEEDAPDVYDMASAILDRFPRLEKVIVCSKSTRNVQDYNKERDNIQR